MPLLEVVDLSVYYGKASILQGINLYLADGELVSIIGPNGAGKTTLMRAISGFVGPKGCIYYRGSQIEKLAPNEIVERGIILCPERRRLFPEMTVLRNLEMGAYLRKNKLEIRRDMERIFTLFPSLKNRERNLASTLSGGEQQMLAVGRAFMSKPTILMLDEPSFGLAPRVKEILTDALKEIKRDAVTIFLAEQDALLALEAADRSYVLENGKITKEGNHNDLLSDPNVKKAYLGLA